MSCQVFSVAYLRTISTVVRLHFILVPVLLYDDSFTCRTGFPNIKVPEYKKTKFENYKRAIEDIDLRHPMKKELKILKCEPEV